MHAPNRGYSLNRRLLTKAGVASLAALKVSKSISAQEATPEVDDAALAPPAGLEPEILVAGLLDPRFIAVDGDDIYFTETGSGGDEEMVLPGDETPTSMHGQTGKLSKLSADGTVTEIVSDFRSYTFGDHGEIVGAAGLALDGEGNAYVAVGAPGPFVEAMPRTGEEGVVYRVNLESGEKEVIADLIEWEIEENPDPIVIDSNLYGAAYLDGVVYVADAGGNTIISVDAESGEVSTFAVTGGLDAPFLPPEGNPMRDGEMEIDSVPSTIKVGPDGRLYVSYVTGGPFPAGIAPVDAFDPDGTMETYATGLTMVADIAFDSAGRLYASVISTDFINQAPGQIVRVEEDGSQTLIATVPVPAGIEFDDDDNLYALIFSAVAPDGGALVRFVGAADVPAAHDGTPTEPEASPVTDAESGIL